VTPGGVPAHPGELTAAWLTDALRASGVLTGGEVSDVRWHPIGADRGFTGVIARLRLGYSGCGPDERPPASLVAKFPLAERAEASTYSARREDAKAALAQFERAVRELRFYEDVAPRAGVPVPHLYTGLTAPDSLGVVLLLEDIADAAPGDALTGCSTEQAAAVVDAVAPLHAWGREQSDLPDWVPEPPAGYQDIQDRYAGYVEPFLARWGERLPGEVVDVVRRLADGLADVLAGLDAAPATLVHGDLHLDNVLFPGRPDRPVVVLDWQGIRRGPAVVDVASFVIGALEPTERRAAADGIFTRFAARLAECGVTDYSVADLRKDTRLVLLRWVAGAIGWVVAAVDGTAGSREQALVDAAFGDGRLVSALRDYQAAAALPPSPLSPSR
jgi:aminoglycoside phosphotransferase (APT) family kinase protein